MSVSADPRDRSTGGRYFPVLNTYASMAMTADFVLPLGLIRRAFPLPSIEQKSYFFRFGFARRQGDVNLPYTLIRLYF